MADHFQYYVGDMDTGAADANVAHVAEYATRRSVGRSLQPAPSAKHAVRDIARHEITQNVLVGVTSIVAAFTANSVFSDLSPRVTLWIIPGIHILLAHSSEWLGALGGNATDNGWRLGVFHVLRAFVQFAEPVFKVSIGIAIFLYVTTSDSVFSVSLLLVVGLNLLRDTQLRRRASTLAWGEARVRAHKFP